MPVVKVPDDKLSRNNDNNNNNLIPDVIDPKVYLEQFFEWIQPPVLNSVNRTVGVRLTWLHATSVTENGIVNYGEIVGNESLKLQFHPLKKMVLAGSVSLYQSDERHNPIPNALGLFPFDPDQKDKIELKIFRTNSEIEITFLPSQKKWTVTPTYAGTSNLLYGFPSGDDVPIVKPMILLSLSKQ